MTQISIENALERIGSTKQRDRRDGLQDLKHILSSSKRSQRLRDVRDRGYHAIIEALFRLAQNEKSNYTRYSKGSKSQAASILTECAGIFRLAIEVGVKDIRQKTLRAIIDHVIDALPEGDGHFCEPLATHYLRAFVTILQYQPHAGHLFEAQWLQAIEFCQASIRLYIRSEEESDSFNLMVPSRSSRRNDRLSRGSSPSSLSGIVTPVQKSFAGDTQRPQARNNHIINDLVACLYYLLRVPHARVIEVAKSTLDIISEFLDGTAPLSQPQGQEKAFACFNVLLTVASTENLDLAKLVFEKCIHHGRRLWHAKAHDTLKDQLLGTLGLGAPFLETALAEDDELQQTRSDLELLLDVLTIDYSKRQERDLLQQEDLESCDDWSRVPTYPFLLPSIRIRSGTRRAEHAAIMLFTIARLHQVLFYADSEPAESRRRVSDQEDHRPRKRQKKSGPLEPVLAEVTKAKGTEQVARLQVLTFLAAGPKFNAEILQEFLDFVSGFVSHESNIISAWALMTAALLAFQPYASSTSLGDAWLQVWKLATQKLSNPATSRLASHLVLTLVKGSLIHSKVVAEATDSMLASIELNGPISFSDFSINMWIKLVEIKVRQSPSTASDVASRLIRWVFLRWQPAQIVINTPEFATKSCVEAQDILRLFAELLGTDLTIPKQREYDELGTAALACLKMLKMRPLINFLLLQSTQRAPQLEPASLQADEKVQMNLSDAQFQRLQSVVADTLLAEIQTCVQAVSEGGRGVRNITADGASALSSLSLASIWIGMLPRGRASSKLQRLVKEATSLAEEVAKLILGSPQKHGPLHGVLRSIGPLTRLPQENSGEQIDTITQGAVRLFASVFHIDFWRSVHNTQRESDSGPDLMEVDELSGSQPGPRSKMEDEERPADWLSYSTSSTSNNALMSLRTCLAACLHDMTQPDDSADRSSIPPAFMEFVLERPPSDVLYCRNFFKELLVSNIAFDLDQVERLLTYLGEDILHCYEFERSEIAMGMCLDFLTQFVQDWTTSEDEVADLASQFYDWFTNVAVGKNISSPHVHTCLSKMLQKIIAIRPEYARNLSLPSARATLLKILENGQVCVKFETGVDLSSIFGCFILKEHDAILDDVIEHLPMEIDWLEGTAVRIYILANLAASWPTLIRRCLFALVETPFLVQSATEYARYCIDTLSNKLKLQNSNELFRLFASQIIYSWLESRPLESLPYTIFDYPSLKNLLYDVQDEVVAQVLMRGREQEARVLEDVLSETWQDLLISSFGKSAAYAIARDAAVAPNVDHEAARGVSRLTKLLGKDKYRSLIATKFPEILATFFKLIDREDTVLKGFEKYAYHAPAANAYDEIRSSGTSESGLASSQQPSFKASCLADEIDYICNRSGYGVESMWTPALYVYVFRELVSTLHDALGPLHSIIVVQRIRILVSMAGHAAITDYPLEMTLHALRPLLVKTYCAEDSMGIFRYLLTEGQQYLQNRPSYLTGLGIAILVSLRRFISTPQESTTQESQHIGTMKKAEAFHNWVGLYLEKCQVASDNDELANRWAIIDAARNVRSNGCAIVGQAESELLKTLLQDGLSGTELVDEAYRSLILNMLCAEFRLPERSRDDIIHLDCDAVKFANAVWSSWASVPRKNGYRLWVARIIGRAYASAGHVSPNLIEEADIDFSPKYVVGSSQFVTSESRYAILKRLDKVLLSDRSKDVGLVEATLQAIAYYSETDESIGECLDKLPQTLLASLAWRPYTMPTWPKITVIPNIKAAFSVQEGQNLDDWSRAVCLAAINCVKDDCFACELLSVVASVEGLASELFPYIIHLALLRDYDNSSGGIGNEISACICEFFKSFDVSQAPYARLIIKTILYLRTQTLPRQVPKAKRTHWIEIDFYVAAEVAIRCNMFKTALLFLEIRYSEAIQIRTSRRASEARSDLPNELLSIIFQNLDEKDSFYGLSKPPNLKALMSQLEFENAGFKSLSFRGAAYDSELQQHGQPLPETESSLLNVLNNLDMDGLSLSMFAGLKTVEPTIEEIMFTTARKLEHWDLASPLDVVSSSNELFRVFQDIHDAASFVDIRASLDRGFGNIFDLVKVSHSAGLIHANLGALATLTEIEDVLSSEDLGTLDQVWSRMEKRESWMVAERFDRTQSILSCRKTLFSMLSKSPNLQQVLNISSKAARTIETRSLLASSSLFRQHETLQTCLGNATVLDSLVEQCKALGLLVDVSAQYEVSNVMWDQGEMVSSIQILHDILGRSDLNAQAIPVARPVLLARLGHRVSEARLEKPDEIIGKYLVPAIEELHGYADGPEAGQAYHEFAAFCDQQLQNSDNTEDIDRIRKLRDQKETEVRELEKMLKAAAAQSPERGQLKNLLTRAKQWLELDNHEYNRLRDGRQTLLQRSLENYLLCLKSCDSFDNDALRFSALWLESSEDDAANATVSKYLNQVPSGKFATLMNQWTSRLLDTGSPFQKLLMTLVTRICVDHPYHGMYHIFTSGRSKVGRDHTAVSRQHAALAIMNELKANPKVGSTWLAIHNTSINYVRFAAEKPEDGSMKQGGKIQLRRLSHGQKLEQDVKTLKIPPPTMKIALRSDCDYSGVPVIQRYQAEFTIASGISMPKILTALASDGRRYKQLFKSGNDDLRQDAIMEQVFEQVSNLLRSQRESRLRNLAIRTYRVLPLTATAGVIEFVPNTIPIHDYLMPAHQKYFPLDLKNTACRKMISDAQSKPNEQRIQVYRKVCEKFHPVLRYFFMERFESPDNWYAKRLAYTRSTAAISILGHILGLGDRHGHNILLDETTGEVVHIDLGIAFEQGRVLPVPEVVPFRLTRDLVDGMGMTKTEGVFRRCCEFTLDALRKETYSIMTILDVLRYDPLYSWSISPLRMKRLQEQQAEMGNAMRQGQDAPQHEKKDEQGEADRALTVVSKKLSKTLSVSATVNELIQQATDERNLALLYCGWAAYA